MDDFLSDTLAHIESYEREGYADAYRPQLAFVKQAIRHLLLALDVAGPECDLIPALMAELPSADPDHSVANAEAEAMAKHLWAVMARHAST
jgi:hypothetical protein